MDERSSIALLASQAMLHCPNKALLYAIDMTLGKRIRSARLRLAPKPTQQEVGDEFGITDKAVSSWERDESVPELEKAPKLARKLKVPLDWLLEGNGPPPPPDDIRVCLESLSEADRLLLNTLIQTLNKQRSDVA
jgi:transcriptional regulator with XRE-family HTH domain